MVNTSMTHVFRHPKFYRIPRDKSDQVISESTHDGESERAPGPGHKHQAPSIKRYKHQASSFRTNLFNRQATSIPARVTSVKLQALSYKLPDPRTMEHGYWRSFLVQRTEGLYNDKCILRMPNMEGNLMRTESAHFLPFCDL